MTAKLLAFHLDLKRPMWRRDYLDRTIARLRDWGFNALLFEFEDKLRFRRHPDLAHPEAWSPEQAADFVRACRQQGLDVIPMYPSLGHAECVVGKPPYAHLRESPDVPDQYDPLSLEARALLLELFDEIIEIFQPRHFIHVGGDETWSLGKSAKCQPLVQEIGVGGLYLQHMRPILDHIRARGLRPLLWADMVLQHAEVLDQLPRDTVLVDWHYSRVSDRADRAYLWHTGNFTWSEFQALPDSPAKQLATRFAVDDQTRRDGTFRAFYHTDALLAKGFDVLTASAVRSAGDTVAFPRIGHLENVFHSARKGLTAGHGEIVTNWAVRYNHPELTLPAAFAAGASQLDRAALVADYTRQVFGVALPELADAWQLLSPPVAFSETMALWPAAKLLAAGQDPLTQLLADLRARNEFSLIRRSAVANEQSADWLADARALVVARRADYLRGRQIIETLVPRLQTNADRFEYWREAADLAVFYADFAVAALHERLPAESAALLARLIALRERTRQLWARTYTAGSIADELTVRYGLHEACLRGQRSVNLTPLIAHI